MSIKFPLIVGLAILSCGAFSETKAQSVSPLARGETSVYINEEVIIVRRHRRHGHWVRMYRHGHYVGRRWVYD